MTALHRPTMLMPATRSGADGQSVLSRDARTLTSSGPDFVRQVAGNIGRTVHPASAVLDAVGNGLFGIVDRIVHYRLEAKRIDAQTQQIRMQADLMSQKIKQELSVQMAELKNRRIALLQLCQQAQFDQKTIRQAMQDKQAKAQCMLNAALAAETPLEEKKMWLTLYQQESEACTALLQLSTGNFKERAAILLPALSMSTTPFRLEN